MGCLRAMTTAIGLVQSVCALRVVTPRALPAQDTTATERASSASAVRGQLVRRDSVSAYRYTRPRPFHAIIAVPGTLGASAREGGRARYLPVWGARARSASA